MKKWGIISVIVIVAAALSYWFMYQLPKNEADKAIDKYIAKQNVRHVQVRKSKIVRNWKMGGFYKFVEYNDDKNYGYQYHYISGSNWKNHISIDVGQLEKGKKPKYEYTDE